MKTFLTALLLAVVCCGPLAATLRAQESPPSVSELRRENEQLRQRIDELEAQLAKSQESINQLLEQVRELNSRVAELQRLLERRPAPQGESDSAPESAEPAPSTPTLAELPEAQPFVAPEGLLRLVRESYKANFGEVTVPFETSDARARYLRDVEAWANSLRRTQRGQVEWLIEIRQVLSNESPMVVEYRVLDRETRQPYSDRVFSMQVPPRFERRMRDAPTQTWLLRGVAWLDININRDRDSMGFFDVTPFIGPYVEFGFDLNVNAVLAAPAPETEDGDEVPADPDAGPDGGSDSP